VTITGNYPDPAFVIQHCGEAMPRLATIDGHGDLINSTYPPSLVPTVNIVRCIPRVLPCWLSSLQHLFPGTDSPHVQLSSAAMAALRRHRCLRPSAAF